ncbi:MAG: lysine N(6)-hydroxylase/L-ornithine N(5)-oxygenase family protein [Deltaproteobacteria bacterium]|nr:lysine N(6)-hydroxylase/L-ornithine N(5)-oxygenase family protein [Deltaproteobacteria bacterium]
MARDQRDRDARPALSWRAPRRSPLLRPPAVREAGRWQTVGAFCLSVRPPGRDFFRAHTELLVREHELNSLRERGRATAIARLVDGSRVETDQGALDSRRVVLAPGLGEQLCAPAWARPFDGDARIERIFSASFSREAATAARSVAIVGGGIAAASCPARWQRQGPR